MILRLLFVEDSPADAELAIESLSSAGLQTTAQRVVSRADFERALSAFRPHVILFDHGVPGFSALAALEVLDDAHLPTPFIVLTGGLDDAEAVACLRAGADDLVLKAHLDRLRPAIERALAAREALFRLSPRQIEVLRLIAEGMTTSEIAAELGISVKTADTHRTQMMRRLDMHDVASLVRFAVEVRLVRERGGGGPSESSRP